MIRTWLNFNFSFAASASFCINLQKFASVCKIAFGRLGCVCGCNGWAARQLLFIFGIEMSFFYSLGCSLPNCRRLLSSLSAENKKMKRLLREKGKMLSKNLFKKTESTTHHTKRKYCKLQNCKTASMLQHIIILSNSLTHKP